MGLPVEGPSACCPQGRRPLGKGRGAGRSAGKSARSPARCFREALSCSGTQHPEGWAGQPSRHRYAPAGTSLPPDMANRIKRRDPVRDMSLHPPEIPVMDAPVLQMLHRRCQILGHRRRRPVIGRHAGRKTWRQGWLSVHGPTRLDGDRKAWDCSALPRKADSRPKPLSAPSGSPTPPSPGSG